MKVSEYREQMTERVAVIEAQVILSRYKRNKTIIKEQWNVGKDKLNLY